MNFQGGGFSSFSSPGGGFMKGEGGESSERTTKKVESVVPVNINMIHSASPDGFTIHDNAVHTITFVGVVKEINETSNNTTYKIDDCTSDSVSVTKWLSLDDNNAVINRPNIREETYVRIFGHLKFPQDGRVTVSAINVKPITDHNEITYHILDVIYTNLMLQKKSEPGGFGGAKQEMSFSGGGGGMDSSFGGSRGADMGLNKTQAMVHDAISACTDDQGMGFQELSRSLALSASVIREAIEFLSNEGHIYSTVDDDHFKSTTGC